MLHLALVHVPADISVPAHPVEPVDLPTLEEQERESAYLDSLVERLSAAGVRLSPALLRGHVADALSRHVQEQGIDLVVMTTHGRGGLQRAWLGSTADVMVRHCQVPVLLIRPSDETGEIGPVADRAFHRILAALDGSEIAERSLNDAVRLGITAEAEIVLLHVMPPSLATAAPYLPHTVQLTGDELAAREAYHRGYLEGVSRCEGMAGRVVEARVVADYDPAPAILDVAEEVGADLIVMGTHGRGGLPRVLLGSVADKVIRGTSRAVLVHRGPAAATRLGGRFFRSHPVEDSDAPAPA
jgi:nucleotide-binding universal stress UspA family protein